MGIAGIRQLIDAAVAQEQRTGELRADFAARLPELQGRLLLPDNPLDTLVEFTRRYIYYVPDFIETLARCSCEAGSEDFVAPFLHMAEDFFLAPPEELADDHGLQALLDEAFLAQRLLEEANDRHIRLQRSQLVPLDMTRANIIVHHLIGDELANTLDQLVERGMLQLLERERLFEGLDATASLTPLERPMLPCMSRDLEIDLRLQSAGVS